MIFPVSVLIGTIGNIPKEGSSGHGRIIKITPIITIKIIKIAIDIFLRFILIINIFTKKYLINNF